MMNYQAKSMTINPINSVSTLAESLKPEIEMPKNGTMKNKNGKAPKTSAYVEVAPILTALKYITAVTESVFLGLFGFVFLYMAIDVIVKFHAFYWTLLIPTVLLFFAAVLLVPLVKNKGWWLIFVNLFVLVACIPLTLCAFFFVLFTAPELAQRAYIEEHFGGREIAIVLDGEEYKWNDNIVFCAYDERTLCSFEQITEMKTIVDGNEQVLFNVSDPYRYSTSITIPVDGNEYEYRIYQKADSSAYYVLVSFPDDLCMELEKVQ